MRLRRLGLPFGLVLLLGAPGSAGADGGAHPATLARHVEAPRVHVAPPRTAPVGHATPARPPAEELGELLPELKAARRELDGGVVSPARRATIEALVAKVRVVASKLPPHEVSGRAKADYVADGVLERLAGIANGTLVPPVPDVDVRAALAAKHAPKVPERELKGAMAAWARGLSAHANSSQPEKVRGLVAALEPSGYAAPQAMDLLAEVLAEELETRGVFTGGWPHHFVEEQIFQMAGFSELAPRPVGWGRHAAAPRAAVAPLHALGAAGRARLHPETRAILGDFDAISATRARVLRPQLVRSAARQGVTRAELDAVRDLFRRAPIHVRFRLSAKLLDGLEKDPTWKNVHESGTTAGNPDLFARKAVEGDLGFFDDAAPASERPKYGYLNVTNAPLGQAGHYGDVVLVLRQDVKRRATVCFGDSFGGGKMVPAYPITSFEHPEGALAPLASREVLPTLVEVATGRRRSAPYPFPLASDRYVEVQIFGTLDLAKDVEAIVLGPEAAASPERARLVALATRLGIPLHVTPASGFSDIGFTP